MTTTYRVAKKCYRLLCEATRGFKGRHVALTRGLAHGSWTVSVQIAWQRAAHTFQLLGDDANKAFGEWMRGKEDVKAAGLLFERELGSGDNMLETDDELRSRIKERLRQMSEAGVVAVVPGLAVCALPLHEMTRDQLEEYAEMMGIAEPKEST